MKRLTLFALLSLLLPLAAATAQQQNSGQPSAKQKTETSKPARASSPQLRRKTFEVVWRTVQEKYFDPNFGGLDWDKVRERYAPQVETVKTDDEFYDLLNKMLSEFHISHLGVASPEAIESDYSKPRASVGIDLRILDGLIVITRITPNSPAARAGLRPGFVVRKINDTLLDEQKLDAAIDVLGGEPQTKIRLTYLNAEDREHEATLERELLQQDTDRYKDISLDAEFESKRLPNGIGYIRFSQFITSLNKKIRAAILSMSDAPGIIIDLRGNGGGDDEVGIKLANLLFAKRTVLMITKTREGDDDYYQARPEKRTYSGPVVILQDERSGSASEQFAAGMQESGRAFVIGIKSQGDDMDADLKKLPTGAYLVYAYGQPRTPKGVVIEGRGVIPNLEISLTRAELLKGNDSQLDAAIEYIRKQKNRLKI